MVSLWALIDQRPGTANQVLGASAHTGFSVTEKKLYYSGLSRIPNALFFGGSAFGVNKATRKTLVPPWPDAIIAAGRRSAPVSLYIKRKNPATKIIHMMHPDLPLDLFDMVLLPRHDQQETCDNVVQTFGAPHNLTEENLFEARARLPLNPDLLPKPWTLLCLGGNTPHGMFKLSDIHDLIEGLAPMMHNQGTILLTSSRRTPQALLRATTERIHQLYPHISLSVYSPSQAEENPYRAWLAQADRIVVTADSVSMACEAAYTGKPLYLFVPKEAASPKHVYFAKDVVSSDYGRYLVDYDPLWNGGPRLDEAARVARDIVALVYNGAYWRQSRDVPHS